MVGIAREGEAGWRLCSLQRSRCSHSCHRHGGRGTENRIARFIARHGVGAGLNWRTGAVTEPAAQVMVVVESALSIEKVSESELPLWLASPLKVKLLLCSLRRSRCCIVATRHGGRGYENRLPASLPVTV